MDTIEKIKSYIAKGDTGKAIELLVEYTKENNSPLQDEAILLSGQFRQWKREITLGVQQSNTDLRRIELGIMNVLQEKSIGHQIKSQVPSVPLSSPTPTPPQKSNMMPILAGILGLALIGFGFWYFSDHDHVANNETPIEEPEMTGGTSEVQPVDPEIAPREVTNPQIVPSGNSAEVKGPTVNFAAFGAQTGAEHLGFFRNTGNGKWVEEDKNFNTKFSFDETSRDEWSVYMHDRGRDMRIQLDLAEKTVRLSEGDGPQRVQYHIKDAISNMNGHYLKKVTYKHGSGQAGFFEKTTGKNWVEKNPDSGAEGFKYREVNRDDGSVYLFSDSGGHTITLDMYKKEVRISEEGTSDSGLLYKIVSGI